MKDGVHNPRPGPSAASYELATGRPPFASTSLNELMADHEGARLAAEHFEQTTTRRRRREPKPAAEARGGGLRGRRRGAPRQGPPRPPRSTAVRPAFWKDVLPPAPSRPSRTSPGGGAARQRRLASDKAGAGAGGSATPRGARRSSAARPAHGDGARGGAAAGGGQAAAGPGGEPLRLSKNYSRPAQAAGPAAAAGRSTPTPTWTSPSRSRRPAAHWWRRRRRAAAAPGGDPRAAAERHRACADGVGLESDAAARAGPPLRAATRRSSRSWAEASHCSKCDPASLPWAASGARGAPRRLIKHLARAQGLGRGGKPTSRPTSRASAGRPGRERHRQLLLRRSFSRCCGRSAPALPRLARPPHPPRDHVLDGEGSLVPTLAAPRPAPRRASAPPRRRTPLTSRRKVDEPLGPGDVGDPNAATAGA